MENNLSPALPEAATLDKSASGLLRIATTFIIDSPMMYNQAAEELKAIKAKYNALDNQRKGITTHFDQAKQKVMDLFRGPLAKLEQAEALLKSSMLTYQQAEEKKRIAAQRIADEEARIEREKIAAEARAKQEEADRLAKQADDARRAKEQAEQDKIDAAAKVLKAQQDADAAIIAGNEQAAADAQAQLDLAEQAIADANAAASEANANASLANLQAMDAQDDAATLELSAAIVTAPAVVSSIRRVGGISTAKSWKARVTDKAALLAYIAAHPECLDWVDVKMTPLNGMAKALKQNMAIPGVEAYPEETLSARAAY